ncbi:MAG: hypothetical protein QOJ35_323 [Solirubrobacteraceae bacterium]|nr:hypothetical protein [Solirubrobacteraceae bacterium]
MRGASATAPGGATSDLGRRIASGDPRAMHELVAARAAAVHAFAVTIGMSEGRTAFVVAVLAEAQGAYDVDQQLLAAARDMSAGEQASRRRRRRAERSFAAALAQAVPISVAGTVLRMLDERRLAQPPAPAARRAIDAPATATGAGPATETAAATGAGLAPATAAGVGLATAPATETAAGAGLATAAAPPPAPAAGAGLAPAAAPLAPRSTGPGDWVPASLGHVNGVAHPPRHETVAPPIA